MNRNFDCKTGYLVFKTQNGNNYLYSSRFNNIMLIHPLMSHLIDLYEKGTNDKSTINKTLNDKIRIESNNLKSNNELSYIYKKFKFLHKKGYFENSSNNLNKRYKGEDIKKYLSNTYQVTFEVTEKCNLKCDYCLYGKLYCNRDKRIGLNIDFDIAKNLLNYLVDLWNSELNDFMHDNIYIGFYGGEPLLNFEVIQKIVEYSKTISLQTNSLKYTMTTNALLLDKHMDFLAKNNFDLLISLDGGTEDDNYYRKLPAKKSAFNI
jgi:uncharacterized protein